MMASTVLAGTVTVTPRKACTPRGTRVGVCTSTLGRARGADHRWVPNRLRARNLATRDSARPGGAARAPPTRPCRASPGTAHRVIVDLDGERGGRLVRAPVPVRGCSARGEEDGAVSPGWHAPPASKHRGQDASERGPSATTHNAGCATPGHRAPAKLSRQIVSERAAPAPRAGAPVVGTISTARATPPQAPRSAAHGRTSPGRTHDRRDDGERPRALPR